MLTSSSRGVESDSEDVRGLKIWVWLEMWVITLKSRDIQESRNTKNRKNTMKNRESKDKK